MPLKLVKRPKSDHWIMRGSIKGVRYEETTGTASKKIAEEVRAKREAEILKESVYGKVATATFAHAAVSYLENGGATRFLKPVSDHFGTTPLAKVTQAAIVEGANKVYPKASPSTRNRQFFTPAVAVLRHAAKMGWCAMPVIERPKEPRGKVRWITPEEANRLIAACSPHLRPLVIFMLYTGARTGEALWLDWKHLDLDRRHVGFVKTKNGEARGVPLHDRIIEALRGVDDRTGYVFRRPDGEPYELPDPDDDTDTSAGTRIKTAFRGACSRAGIEKFTPHCCRHTWATWHYQANRDLTALQKLGGWKTLSMVLRYAHTNVAEHAHTINLLPGGKLGDAVPEKAKTA